MGLINFFKGQFIDVIEWIDDSRDTLAVRFDLKDAADRAEAAMTDALRKLCSQEVPGDTQRGLAIYPNYSQRTFRHVLLPLWVLSYNYVGKPYQVLVNGYTGTIAGYYPKSWVKITLMVLAVLIVAIVILALAQHPR